MENEFNEQMNDLTKSIQELLDKYDKYTDNISPKNWRTTGTHYGNLRTMLDDIPNFKEITNEEREIVKQWEK